MESKQPTQQSIILAYVPVIHAGYLQFLNKYPDMKQIYIFDHTLEVDNFLDTDFINNDSNEEPKDKKSDETFAEKSNYLRKEIRALSTQETITALSALLPDKNISFITKKDLENLRENKTKIIAPLEDVTEALIENQLSENPVTYDSIFLRWNRKRFTKQFEVHPDVTISKDEFDKKMIKLAHDQADKSSDWWRQVGGVLMKNSKDATNNNISNVSGKNKTIISTAHNTHLPSQHQPYCDGDPRNCSHKGKNLDLYTAIHAEAKLIANAAKKGISLAGAEMYVTLFPCPVCAKLVAESGISKLYFDEGYGILDGVRVLKDAGVEIVMVGG